MQTIYAQCMSVLRSYLDAKGFISLPIAQWLIENTMSRHIMLRTNYRTPKRWGSICMDALRRTCAARNAKYREALGNEIKGIYVINMLSGQDDSNGAGAV